MLTQIRELSGIRLTASNNPQIQAKISSQRFRDIELRDAHLVGIDFSGGRYPGADFRRADLREAKFCGSDLFAASFRSAIVSDADFTGATLSHADFGGADLRKANFQRADLVATNFTGADLRGAVFPSVPIFPNLYERVYTIVTMPRHDLIAGEAQASTTRRSLAGWAVVAAGGLGKGLAVKFGTMVAAWLLYQAADPTLDRAFNFFESPDTAMVDLKRRAGLEEARVVE